MADWEDAPNDNWESAPAPTYKPRIDPATIVEPNAEQRRMGLRKNRIKDDDLARKVGAAFLDAPEAFGTSIRDQALVHGLPSGVANTAGFVGEMGANLIPIPIGGAKTKLALHGQSQGAARDLMWRALKPGAAARDSGDAAKAVQTLLEEGANVSKGGVEKLTSKINALDDMLDTAIAESAAKLKNTDLLKSLKGVVDEYRAGTLGEKSIAQINEVANTLLRHPAFNDAGEITVQAAQKMKRQNYKELGDAAYGAGLRPQAERDALKAVTRDIKEGIENSVSVGSDLAGVPSAAGAINAQMSPLINARDLALERVLAAANNNPAGLSLLARLGLIPAALMDRSTLAKSILANSLYRGTPSGILGQAGVGGAELLNEAQK